MKRLRAHVRANLKDHAFVRVLWTNSCEFAPGAWRSNQPSPMRLRKMARRGIKTIISLRGAATGELGSISLAESEAQRLGLSYHVVRLRARQAPSRAVLMELLDLFDRAEKPVLMHCKSGADRTGIAAALWLLHIENAPVEEARMMLHWRYAHLPFLRSGIQGHLIDTYAADCTRAPAPVRDWIRERYDPEDLQRSFAVARRRLFRSRAAAV